MNRTSIVILEVVHQPFQIYLALSLQKYLQLISGVVEKLSDLQCLKTVVVQWHWCHRQSCCCQDPCEVGQLSCC